MICVSCLFGIMHKYIYKSIDLLIVSECITFELCIISKLQSLFNKIYNEVRYHTKSRVGSGGIHKSVVSSRACNNMAIKFLKNSCTRYLTTYLKDFHFVYSAFFKITSVMHINDCRQYNLQPLKNVIWIKQSNNSPVEPSCTTCLIVNNNVGKYKLNCTTCRKLCQIIQPLVIWVHVIFNNNILLYVILFNSHSISSQDFCFHFTFIIDKMDKKISY